MTGEEGHTNEPIRVLTVDDHPILREGIASVVNLEPNMRIVGEAEDGAAAVELFRQLKPDVTLMDLQMPRVDGVSATRTIRAEAPAARIIMLTTYSGDAQVLRALEAGAVGYLLKSTLRLELITAIAAVHAGRRYVPTEVASEITGHLRSPTLSNRELEILRMVAEGKSNKEIGSSLGLAEETVKAHLRTVFSKLGVNDRTLAVTTALRRGLIELS